MPSIQPVKSVQSPTESQYLANLQRIKINKAAVEAKQDSPQAAGIEKAPPHADADNDGD